LFDDQTLLSINQDLSLLLKAFDNICKIAVHNPLNFFLIILTPCIVINIQKCVFVKCLSKLYLIYEAISEFYCIFILCRTRILTRMIVLCANKIEWVHLLSYLLQKVSTYRMFSLFFFSFLNLFVLCCSSRPVKVLQISYTFFQ